MELSTCRHCGSQITVGAKACSKCGAKVAKKFGAVSKSLLVVLGVAIVSAILDSPTTDNPQNTSETSINAPSVIAEAPSSPVIIKGIYIGMTKAEYDSLDDLRFLTIGGVNHLDRSVTAPKSEFDKEGKLRLFIFLFREKNFDQLVDAVRAKYPLLKCIDSTVQNRMGALFLQTECNYRELSILRYVNNLDTAALVLQRPMTDLEIADDRKPTRDDL